MIFSCWIYNLFFWQHFNIRHCYYTGPWSIDLILIHGSLFIRKKSIERVPYFIYIYSERVLASHGRVKNISGPRSIDLILVYSSLFIRNKCIERVHYFIHIVNRFWLAVVESSTSQVSSTKIPVMWGRGEIIWSRFIGISI